MTGNMIVGLNTQAAITGSAMTMKTNEETMSSEKKRYKSAITEHHSKGKVRWDFDVDDVRHQKQGHHMPENVLPTVRFKFVGESDEPAPPPENVDIVIVSHWSMTSRNKLKRTWIHKFLRFFKPTGNSQTMPVSCSNLFQIVALTADVSNLSEQSFYQAQVKVNLKSGVSEPPEVPRLEAKSLKPINVTAIVVDGMYLTFADLCDLDYLKRPTFSDLKKLKDFPTIAKFKLSDICDSKWGKFLNSKIQ